MYIELLAGLRKNKLHLFKKKCMENLISVLHVNEMYTYSATTKSLYIDTNQEHR